MTINSTYNKVDFGTGSYNLLAPKDKQLVVSFYYRVEAPEELKKRSNMVLWDVDKNEELPEFDTALEHVEYLLERLNKNQHSRKTERQYLETLKTYLETVADKDRLQQLRERRSKIMEKIETIDKEIRGLEIEEYLITIRKDYPKADYIFRDNKILLLMDEDNKEDVLYSINKIDGDVHFMLRYFIESVLTPF